MGLKRNLQMLKIKTRKQKLFSVFFLENLSFENIAF